MKRLYRAGQRVKVRSSAMAGLNAILGSNERLVDGMIVCATSTCSAYCVATSDYNLVGIVDVSNISAKSEQVVSENPSNVRVVFFGNGNFALPVLKHLYEQGYIICAVVSNPDSRQGRGRQSKATAVAQYARSKGLKVLTPVSVSEPKLISELKQLKPDIGVVVEYGILPKAVYRMPRLGTLNLHSSLLPEYRGASTISSAIRDGKCYTGLTTFQLCDSVDCGHIINNMLIPIGSTDNADDVLACMQLHGPGMVADAIQLVAGGCTFVPQEVIGSYLSATSYAHKVFHDDLAIDWNMTAKQISDFVRAYSPAPSAWTDFTIGGVEYPNVKIHSATATSMQSFSSPGTLITTHGHLLVAASDYMVHIAELQLPGKRRMTALDFCNGLRGNVEGRCSTKHDTALNSNN